VPMYDVPNCFIAGDVRQTCYPESDLAGCMPFSRVSRGLLVWTEMSERQEPRLLGIRPLRRTVTVRTRTVDQRCPSSATHNFSSGQTMGTPSSDIHIAAADRIATSPSPTSSRQARRARCSLGRTSCSMTSSSRGIHSCVYTPYTQGQG
jgi:hypothetical protein